MEMLNNLLCLENNMKNTFLYTLKSFLLNINVKKGRLLNYLNKI